MTSKNTIERVLDSYLNVLYEQESKKIKNFSKKELLRQVYLRVNKKTDWYCKTAYQRRNKPEWL